MTNIPDYYLPYKKIFDLIGKDKSNIVIINNFIEKDHVESIQEYLKKYESNDEFLGGKDLRYEKVVLDNPYIASLLRLYEEKTFQVIKDNFMDRYGIDVWRNPENRTHFVKWVESMDTKLHADCEKPDGTPATAANFYKYSLSVLMYPNSNYEGGEISFPEYGVKLKPSDGDLIIFPSNSAYSHIVSTITKGVRYTMPSWFTFNVDGIEPTNDTKDYTFLDSVQLWEGQEVNPVGPGWNKNSKS